MRKIVISIVILIAGFALASGAAIFNPITSDIISVYSEVLNTVKAEYVKDVKNEKLLESSLSGMLSSLDPHSGYMNEEEFKDMKETTKGEFGGLGIELVVDNGLKIISPIDDTPAYKAGIMPGDLIVAVNGSPISSMSPNEAIGKMRGKPGTNVEITIIRKGQNKPLEFKLTRALIKVKAVKNHLYDDIGYIRISSFSSQAASGVRKAVMNLNRESKNPIKGYILDLRNNPGGLLDQAIYIVELFQDKGIIVSTKGRNKKDNMVYRAHPGNLIKNLPIVVLINGGSASASEIVAGALQDHKLAVVMGTKSFGKGSVQTVIPIKGHGAMRLTTAIYYTPSGRSIQAEGIQPDIVVEPAKIDTGEERKGKRFSEASLNGHLENEKGKSKSEEKKQDSSIKEVKRKQWKELYDKDYQLARAIDLLKTVHVFGKK